MKERGYDFIAIYVSMLEDARFMRLPDADKAAYFLLSLLAGRAYDYGRLTDRGAPMDSDTIAWALRADPADMPPILERLRAADFLEYTDGCWAIARWVDDQVDLEYKREAWRNQKRAQRARLSDQSPAQETVTETEAETEAETETEKSRVEKSRVENTRGVRADTTRTEEPSSSSTPSNSLSSGLPESSSEPLEKATGKPPLLIEIAGMIRARGEDPYPDVIHEAIASWVRVAQENGWNPSNRDAILERYDALKTQKQARKSFPGATEIYR